MNDIVTVIGLGAMGLPMATRLDGRFEVRGFDVAAERTARAAEHGIACASSAAEAVAGAGTVLVAVRTGDELEALLFGPDGLAEALDRGAVVVLTSTVGTDGIDSIAARVSARGAHVVDAPLSGGPVRAGQGDLLIVVGAEPAALERVRPVLDRLASTVVVAGERPGDGQALKTVNQLLCGVHIAAAAEALALADALGLDRERTLAALTAGAADSFMLGDRGPRALQAYDQDGAEVRGRLDLFVKDLGIVGRAAAGARLAVPVAAAAEQLFRLGKAQGLGERDDSALIRVIAPERRGGTDAA